MTKDKALEIAIEWMEGLIQYLPSTKEHKATMSRYNKAITAIKESLAQQEPCDMGAICIGCSPRNADGSCPSSQRTWVGLTDDEMEATFIECGGKWNGDFWKIEDADFHPFLRTIEAKLKDKNCVG